jgi:hypothetical protein
MQRLLRSQRGVFDCFLNIEPALNHTVNPPEIESQSGPQY